MIVSALTRIRAGAIALLEWTVILLFAALVLDVLWGVLSRASGGLVAWLDTREIAAWPFLPRGQTRWTEEVAIYLMMWISLLGAAVAYGLKAHLGVDYVVGKLHPAAQPLAGIIAHVMSGIFAVFVLLGGGYVLVTETLAAGQLTPALKMKVGYLYLAVPVCGAFITLFALEHIVEIALGKQQPPESA